MNLRLKVYLRVVEPSNHVENERIFNAITAIVHMCGVHELRSTYGEMKRRNMHQQTSITSTNSD